MAADAALELVQSSRFKVQGLVEVIGEGSWQLNTFVLSRLTFRNFTVALD